jgi:hypothetical protein
MSAKSLFISYAGSLLIYCLMFCVPVMSQQATGSPPNPSADRTSDSTMDGVVVSSSRSTLVVRTEDNQYRLFVFDNNTVKPRSISSGAHVRVESSPGDEPGVRVARVITVTESTGAQQPGATPQNSAQVPEPVRNLETEIKRGVRRWHVGVRAGSAFDPELFLFGVHSQIGPIFHRNVYFRPNAEFAFGEVTDLIALNLETTYRLPITSREGRWSTYVGAGPALNFIHQSFNNSQGTGRNISFGNFDYETGFNVLTGLQFRKGTFFEMKTSLWSKPAPVLRLIVGYNF